MMDKIHVLDKIETAILTGRNVGEACRMLNKFVEEHKYLNVKGKINDVEDDYRLMKEYMLKGYKDDKREDVYDGLLKRLYSILVDIQIRMRVILGIAMSDISGGSTQDDLTLDGIHSTLEGFVQDVAMLSLCQGEDHGRRKKDVYERHKTYVNILFNSIVVSPQWQDDTADFYENLLLSPLIDTNDAQLITSAIMLSAMNFLDMRKIHVLMSVYQKATDEHIRQRALVGWVFSLPNINSTMFNSLAGRVGGICEDENVRRELVELQMQVFYCLNAERDNDEIQKEILPNLMKNDNFRITQFGIEEKDDDPMRDILNPGAADKAMEEMESTFNKMIDMQKAGADIYFGGFSHMKTFRFFRNIGNWFCPFYIDNPALEAMNEKLPGSKFMQTLLENGPFCDSDKYSFVFAMLGVMDKLPGNVAEMLNNAGTLGPMAPGVDTNSAAYIRRMYLQDMYRFFRVYNYRDEFRNPFNNNESDSEALFFIKKVFISDKLEDGLRELGGFFVKRKLYGEAWKVSERLGHSDNIEDLLLRATLESHFGDYEKARQTYESIITKDAENVVALRGVAYASFYCGDYKEAEIYYAKLCKLKPGSRGYTLNLCISQVNNDHASDGVAGLYKLNYEYLSDKNIKRALGWGQMNLGKFDIADKLYAELLAADKPLAMDYLNAGYCKWFMGKTRDAASMFKAYLSSGQDLGSEFSKDARLLGKNGISEVDVKLMVDIVSH